MKFHGLQNKVRRHDVHGLHDSEDVFRRNQGKAHVLQRCRHTGQYTTQTSAPTQQLTAKSGWGGEPGTTVDAWGGRQQ